MRTRAPCLSVRDRPPGPLGSRGVATELSNSCHLVTRPRPDDAGPRVTPAPVPRGVHGTPALRALGKRGRRSSGPSVVLGGRGRAVPSRADRPATPSITVHHLPSPPGCARPAGPGAPSRDPAAAPSTSFTALLNHLAFSRGGFRLGWSRPRPRCAGWKPRSAWLHRPTGCAVARDQRALSAPLWGPRHHETSE